MSSCRQKFAAPGKNNIIISCTIEEAALAQVTVRELEEEVKQGLKRRAARHGHSMEEEVRQILRSAVKDENLQVVKLGSRIAACFVRVGLKQDLPELHNQAIRPPDSEA